MKMNFGKHYIPSEIIGEIVSHVSNPRDLQNFFDSIQLKPKQKMV